MSDTVPQSERIVSLEPGAGTLVLPYDFLLMSPQDLDVLLLRDNVWSQLFYPGDFTFPGGLGTAAGGSLTLAAPSLDGDLFVLAGDILVNRSTDYVNRGGINPELLNADLNRLVRINQETSRNGRFALKFRPGSAPVSTYLPPAVPGRLLMWDEDAAGIVSGPTAGDIADAQSNAEIARDERIGAEQARDAAEGFAAGLNLPAIAGGDSGKVLTVRADLTGYKLDYPLAGLVQGEGVIIDLTDPLAPVLSVPLPVLPRRNRVPNPTLVASQENGNAPGTGNGYYPADCWRMDRVTSAGVVSAERVPAATPKGSPARLRLTIDTADSVLGAGEYLSLSTFMEGTDIADFRFGTGAAVQSMVQFGCKGPAGTYGLRLTNSSDSRSFVALFTIEAGEANADTYKNVIVPGDVLGTWRTDHRTGLCLSFVLACGSDFHGAEGWQNGAVYGTAAMSNGLGVEDAVFEFFDVAFYADPDATGIAPAWEPPDIAAILARVKREFEIIAVDASQALTVAMNTSTTVSRWVLDYLLKRARPVVTLPTSIVPLNSGGAFMTVSGHSVGAREGRAYVVTTITGSTVVAGDAALIVSNGGSAIKVDARLSYDLTGFMGDSYIVHLLTTFQNWPRVINAGVGGNTTAQMAARYAADITALGPTKSFILGGINDIIASVSTSTIVANIKTMADASVAAGLAKSDIVLGLLVPVGGAYASYNAAVDSFNAALEAMALSNGYTKVIDFNSAFKTGGVLNAALYNGDLLHPNATGHAVMRPLIEAALA